MKFNIVPIEEKHIEGFFFTVSDAFRMLLTRIAKEHALPFEPLTPNQKTIDAMKEARCGQLKSFKTVQSLMDDLNNEDD